MVQAIKQVPTRGKSGSGARVRSLNDRMKKSKSAAVTKADDIERYKKIERRDDLSGLVMLQERPVVVPEAELPNARFGLGNELVAVRSAMGSELRTVSERLETGVLSGRLAAIPDDACRDTEHRRRKEDPSAAQRIGAFLDSLAQNMAGRIAGAPPVLAEKLDDAMKRLRDTSASAIEFARQLAERARHHLQIVEPAGLNRPSRGADEERPEAVLSADSQNPLAAHAHDLQESPNARPEASRHPAPPMPQFTMTQNDAQGMTYRFASWGAGHYVRLERIEGSDGRAAYRMRASDQKVETRLKSYSEASAMPDEWSISREKDNEA
jgi:hypothetical protein